MKKYKLKTHKATAKRVRRTGSGEKFVHFKMSRSHHRRTKSGRTSRSLDKKFQLSEGNAKKMTQLLPYQ